MPADLPATRTAGHYRFIDRARIRMGGWRTIDGPSARYIFDRFPAKIVGPRPVDNIKTVDKNSGIPQFASIASIPFKLHKTQYFINNSLFVKDLAGTRALSL